MFCIDESVYIAGNSSLTKTMGPRFFYFNIHTNFRVCLPSSVEFQLGLLLAVCESICL